MTLMDNKAGADSFPKRRMHCLLCLLARYDERADLGHVAQAAEVLQGILRGDRQPPQFLDHEVYYVVGVVLGMDTLDVPYPDGRDGVECEQPLVGQRDQELDREERVAAG